MNDITSVQIGAGIFGTVSLSMFIFMLMQIIKGFTGDKIAGPWAEGMVLGVSAIAVIVALASVNADPYKTSTYVSFVAGTIGATVIARGLYAQLFKVSVAGSPPSSDAAATEVTDPGPEGATTTKVTKSR